MHKHGIVWMASFPKSGNTWFRIVLTHILHASKEALDLNKQSIIGVGAAARFVLDKALGFDSALLTDDELAQLRPLIYRWYGEQRVGVQYFKMHDMFHQVNLHNAIVPRDVSVGIIYFIRNPLDVVISFACHMNCSVDDAIKLMNFPQLTLKGSAANLMSQVGQMCSSWSSHVSSWTSVEDIRLIVLRYEDMSFTPLETFSNAMRFLELNVSDALILEALENSRFEKLKTYEQTFGFRESAPLSGGFFRKGIVGDWENTLNDEQIERIVCNHGALMQRFGYLDQEGLPVRYRSPHKKEIVV